MGEETLTGNNGAVELDDLIAELLEWTATPLDAFLLGVRVGTSADTLSELILRAQSAAEGAGEDDIWIGAGAWEGWRLTTHHARSRHGQPVLVAPNGTAYVPGDITQRASQA